MSEKERDDHDMLIRIESAIGSIDKSVSSMANAFEKHTEDDKVGFDNVHKRINQVAKIVYVGVGVVLALEFAAKFLSK